MLVLVLKAGGLLSHQLVTTRARVKKRQPADCHLAKMREFSNTAIDSINNYLKTIIAKYVEPEFSRIMYAALKIEV